MEIGVAFGQPTDEEDTADHGVSSGMSHMDISCRVSLRETSGYFLIWALYNVVLLVIFTLLLALLRRVRIVSTEGKGFSLGRIFGYSILSMKDKGNLSMVT